MADLVRVLSIRDPQHWRNTDAAAPSGEMVTANGVLGLTTVWACINLLAGTSAALPLMVYRTDAAGARTLAKDHDLYRLLHDSPNSLQTALDFWEYQVAALELWGNAYARKIMMGDRVVSLAPIPPDQVVVRRLGNGLLEYRWSEDGRSYVETSETVLHIRGFGGNPLGGMSTLSFGARAFGLALAIDNSAGSIFRNGVRPSGVLMMDGYAKSPEQRAELEALLVQKFTGAMAAGRPMVLEGGMKWEALTINPEDAQMLQSRAFSVEEICRLFGVPPFMIGHTEKSTSWGTGLEQQTLAFVKFSLARRLERIEQALSKQLLTARDRAEGIVIEFSLEGLLRGDSAGRASFYQSALTNGWMTINEVRALENMPPVPGGDVPRMQSQNVPITSAGGPPQTP